MDIQSELSAATLPPLLELIRFASDLLLTYKYVPRRSDRPLQNAADTYRVLRLISDIVQPPTKPTEDEVAEYLSAALVVPRSLTDRTVFLDPPPSGGESETPTAETAESSSERRLSLLLDRLERIGRAARSFRASRRDCRSSTVESSGSLKSKRLSLGPPHHSRSRPSRLKLALVMSGLLVTPVVPSLSRRNNRQGY